MEILRIFILIIFVESVLCGQYFYSNGTKYYFSAPMKKNWFQAQRYCHANGMHLATVHSEEENQILIDVIYGKFQPAKPDDHFWSSGTDMGQSDLEFYWIESGYATLFTNWMDHHPVAKRDGCILLHAGVHKYKWCDEVCASLWYFICQDRLFTPNASQRNMLLNSTIFGDG